MNLSLEGPGEGAGLVEVVLLFLQQEIGLRNLILLVLVFLLGFLASGLSLLATLGLLLSLDLLFLQALLKGVFSFSEHPLLLVELSQGLGVDLGKAVGQVRAVLRLEYVLEAFEDPLVGSVMSFEVENTMKVSELIARGLSDRLAFFVLNGNHLLVVFRDLDTLDESVVDGLVGLFV